MVKKYQREILKLKRIMAETKWAQKQMWTGRRINEHDDRTTEIWNLRNKEKNEVNRAQGLTGHKQVDQ